MTARELALLTRRLADLTGGGLTLYRGLDVLGAQSKNKTVSGIVGELKADLRSGKSFSQALSRQDGFFPPVYIGLVRTGESSGNLEAAFEELARLLEADLETAQRLRAALAYPAVLLAMAVAVCFFLTLFVIPRFEFLFQDLGQRLPLPTRLLVGFTVFVKKIGWAFALAAAAGGAWILKKKPALLARLQQRVINAPWVREFLQSVNLQRWTRTMTSLLRGGFTVAEALKLSRATVGNRFYADQLGAVLNGVLDGRGLAAALGASSAFPPLLCELVGAGEESGRLEQVFARLAESYRRETDFHLKIALSVLEPALILGMGAVVGFVAVAMLLPIFEMSANIR